MYRCFFLSKAGAIHAFILAAFHNTFSNAVDQKFEYFEALTAYEYVDFILNPFSTEVRWHLAYLFEFNKSLAASVNAFFRWYLCNIKLFAYM